MKVCKFGGSSVADASQIKKVKAILDSDKERTIVVVSAPGKRFSGDEKVTDMLLSCAALAQNEKALEEKFEEVKDRYRDIAEGLGLGRDVIDGELEAVLEKMKMGAGRDYAASRGEHLNAILISKYLGWNYIETEDTIVIGENNKIESESYTNLASVIEKGKKYVIPGFYGRSPSGEVRCFSRGGSDITGAIAARAVMADVYENWTDVTGILAADPRIVTNPATIAQLSYEELQALSHVGTQVLHESAVEPVRQRQIPLQIRNTWQPELPGTRIGLPRADCAGEPSIVGFAGRRNLAMLRVASSGLTQLSGEVLQTLSRAGLNVFYSACGLEQLTVLIDASGSTERLHECTERLRARYANTQIKLRENLSILAALLRGTELLPKLVAAVQASGAPVHYLADARPCLLMIVNDSQYETALRAAYSVCQTIN